VELHRDEASVILWPARIEIVDANGTNKEILSVRDVQARPMAGDETRLVFAGAFGSGIDLCYRLSPAGLHQDITFAQKPPLPEGAVPIDTQVNVVTIVDLGSLDPSALTVESGNERFNLDGGALATTNVKMEPLQISSAHTGGSILCFIQSPIVDSANPTSRLDCASRSFVSEENGTCYLSETLSYRFFEDAQFPVVWDPVVVASSPITDHEVWSACLTYWLQQPIVVDGVTLRIEGGATVKFSPDAGPISLTNGGVVIADGEVVADGDAYPYVGCRDAAYHYITFTSADDDNCGEKIDNPPSGPANSYLAISGSESTRCRVRFCKFARAWGCGGMLYVGANLGAPIEHNVFLHNVQGYGEWYCSLWYGAWCGVSVDIRNNLFVYGQSNGNSCESAVYIYIPELGHTVCDVANNTFVDYCSPSSYPLYYCSQPSDASGTWTANVFSNCHYPTNANVVRDPRRNAYYQTDNLSGETDSILWASNPFESASIGLFYLKEECRAPGLETAGQAGLYDPAGTFTVVPPTAVPPGVGAPPRLFEGNRLYESQTATVRVGYHAIRVDYDVPGPSARRTGQLTIRKGARVTFSHPSSGFGMEAPGNVTLQGCDESGWLYLSDYRVVSNVTQGPIIQSQPPFLEGYGQICVIVSDKLISAKKTRFLSMTCGAIWVL
jgi:hypothetical protein